MPKIISFGKSDIGLKRPNNEDSYVLKPEKGLLVVADGMGGAAAGEVASQIFTETALEVFSIELAKSAGSYDNITAVLCQVTSSK